MNSKLALKKLFDCVKGDTPITYFQIIQQDLDRLENLEKDYEKLKERYKHRAETSKDLCDAVKQYEKAIEILKEHNLQVYHIPDFTTPYLSLNDYGDGSSISIKEYKLLKEVLGNER